MEELIVTPAEAVADNLRRVGKHSHYLYGISGSLLRLSKLPGQANNHHEFV